MELIERFKPKQKLTEILNIDILTRDIFNQLCNDPDFWKGFAYIKVPPFAFTVYLDYNNILKYYGINFTVFNCYINFTIQTNERDISILTRQIVKYIESIMICQSCSSLSDVLNTPMCKVCSFWNRMKPPDKQCSLCDTDLRCKISHQYKCGHWFHRSCSVMNFRRSYTCRLCDADLDEIIPDAWFDQFSYG